MDGNFCLVCVCFFLFCQETLVFCCFLLSRVEVWSVFVFSGLWSFRGMFGVGVFVSRSWVSGVGRFDFVLLVWGSGSFVLI